MNPEEPPPLEEFQLVLLRRPVDAREYDDAALDRIQREHLAFHARLREAGTVATNGPVLRQADESFRGLSLYRVATPEEARAIAETDPAVVAGRLEVEAMTFLCPAGTISLPGAPYSFD